MHALGGVRHGTTPFHIGALSGPSARPTTRNLKSEFMSLLTTTPAPASPAPFYLTSLSKSETSKSFQPMPVNLSRDEIRALVLELLG